MKCLTLAIIVAVALANAAACRGKEHPGGAAPATPPGPSAPMKGTEHPGHEQEHPGQEHPGLKANPDGASRRFGASEIKTAMQTYIDEATREGGGAFQIRDTVENTELALRLVKIHDPVREVAGKGYFACADFQTIDGKTIYDLDVWLSPRGDTLTPTETVIHKVSGKARFTYENDRPVGVK